MLSLSLITGHLSLAAEHPQPLTEVELLKNQNIELQMRLLQQQFAQLQGQKAALEREVLGKRGFMPAEWRVNWAGKRVEKIVSEPREPAPSHVPSEAEGAAEGSGSGQETGKE